MQTYFFSFGLFFSVTWTYQSFCRGHQDREKVIEWVDEVYNALGNPLEGCTESRLMSRELHKIGERSTWRWGTAEARPLSRTEFEDEIEDNPRLVEAVQPLREFLCEADRDTEARTV